MCEVTVGVRSCARLRRVPERRLDTFKNTLLAKIGRFLATNTERAPWHGLQASPAYIVAAMRTSANGAVLNSVQRHRDAASNRGITSQARVCGFHVQLYLRHLERVGDCVN